MPVREMSKLGRGKRLDPRIEASVCQDLADGLPVRQIAERHGVGRHVVYLVNRRNDPPGRRSD